MSFVTEKGIDPPTSVDPERKVTGLRDWLSRLHASYPRIRSFNVTIDPVSIAATSESIETVAVPGLRTTDRIIINKPTNTVGVDMIGGWVSAADQLSVKFVNRTGGAINPPSEIYLITAIGG